VRFCLPLFITAFWVWFRLIMILQYRHHYVHLTWTTHANSPVKVMGVSLSDKVHYSLTNHNTPAKTNQYEPTACFWGSGFIDLGSQPVVQMTEEKAACNKGEIYERGEIAYTWFVMLFVNPWLFFCKNLFRVFTKHLNWPLFLILTFLWSLNCYNY